MGIGRRLAECLGDGLSLAGGMSGRECQGGNQRGGEKQGMKHLTCPGGTWTIPHAMGRLRVSRRGMHDPTVALMR